MSDQNQNCGFQLAGILPPCVLPKGHAGNHTDGFGGFYGRIPDDVELVKVPGAKELRYERKDRN